MQEPGDTHGVSYIPIERKLVDSECGGQTCAVLYEMNRRLDVDSSHRMTLPAVCGFAPSCYCCFSLSVAAQKAHLTRFVDYDDKVARAAVTHIRVGVTIALSDLCRRPASQS
jgi:hypothetical protein